MLAFLIKSLVSIGRIALTNSSYTILLPASFSTTLLSLLKSVGLVFNLPITSWLTLDFKLAKSAFLVKFDVSTPAAFL